MPYSRTPLGEIVKKINDSTGVCEELVDSNGASLSSVFLTPPQVASTQALVSTPGNFIRQPSIPSLKAGIVSDAFIGGATPWTRLWGPNELRQSPWAGSAEFTTPSTAFKHVTAASAANGPAMFRREGASIWIDGGVVTANTGNPVYGNLANFSPGLAAGLLNNTTIALLVYIHRLGPSQTVKLRLGASSSDYVVWSWGAANGQLQEGWNVLLASTNASVETIGASAAPAGQLSFQSGAALTNGWTRGAGTTFDWAQAIGYAAIETTAITARTSLWVEGFYYGGKDKPRLTIGFDIQGAGLDVAKTVMDAYGLVGYAAVPTGNAAPATPQSLWSGADVVRLQSLYAAGWDIVQHTVSHNSFGALSDDGMLISELEACRAQIVAAGCSGSADLHTTPNNSYSNRTVALMAKAGIRWARHGVNAPMLLSRGLVGLANPLVQGANPIALTAGGDAADITRFAQWLTLLKTYGASGHIYTHAVTASPTVGLETRTTTFTSMMALVAAEVAAGNLEVVGPAAFIRDSAPPTFDAMLANPSRLTITPGVSPFDLINTGYKPMRFQISGGTVSAITYSRDGSTFDSVGAVAGQFDVSPGDRLRITYTVAPTIIQYAI